MLARDSSWMTAATSSAGNSGWWDEGALGGRVRLPNQQRTGYAGVERGEFGAVHRGDGEQVTVGGLRRGLDPGWQAVAGHVIREKLVREAGGASHAVEDAPAVGELAGTGAHAPAKVEARNAVLQASADGWRRYSKIERRLSRSRMLARDSSWMTAAARAALSFCSARIFSSTVPSANRR